jgi:predicted nucleic acid-binding protein
VKLLLDINVILDVILAREPWVADSARLLSAVEQQLAEGYVASHTLPTIHYLVQKEKKRKIAARAITDLLRIVQVVPLTNADFQQALILELRDFEDAVQAAAALKIGADALVTRNVSDFRGVDLQIRTPGEIIATLSL